MNIPTLNAGAPSITFAPCAARNAEQADMILTRAARATVRVVRTDEELMIGRSVARWLAASSPVKGLS